MAVESATNETKSKFGVPVTGATGSSYFDANKTEV